MGLLDLVYPCTGDIGGLRVVRESSLVLLASFLLLGGIVCENVRGASRGLLKAGGLISPAPITGGLMSPDIPLGLPI